MLIEAMLSSIARNLDLCGRDGDFRPSEGLRRGMTGVCTGQAGIGSHAVATVVMMGGLRIHTEVTFSPQ